MAASANTSTRPASAIEHAVEQTIHADYRTEDIREAGKDAVGTQEMGQKIIEALVHTTQTTQATS